MKNYIKKAFWLLVLFCLSAVAGKSYPADGTYTMPTTGHNNTGQPVVWSYHWTGTAWQVTIVSGPSTGWTDASGLWLQGSGQYTFYGQTLARPAATAADFGGWLGATKWGGLVLPATGPEDMPQTASLSPNGGAASLIQGQTFSGTATGAQAGNPYNISIVSGQGSASINSATGAYTVTANGPGLIHYKVWISAGGGYTRSPDAESNISVTASKKVKVTIPANTGKYPITYKLYQGGVEIGSHTQMPGATAHIVTIDVGANDGPVTMKAFTSGIMTDGVVFVDDVTGNVEEVLPVTITPTSDDTAPPVTVPKPNTTTSNTTTPKPGGSTGVVWSSTGGAGSDALTNATYREGVGKILDAINTGDVPEAESQETAINEATNEGATTAQSVMDAAADVKDNVQAAKTALTDKQPIIIPVSGSQLVYSYTLAQIGKTWTVDLTFLQTPITLMRTVIKVLFMLFMWFLYARTLRSSQV